MPGVFSGHVVFAFRPLGSRKMPFDDPNRRSGRLRKQVKATLRWHSASGEERSVDGYTEIISRHGCIIRCATPHRVPLDVVFADVERGREAAARVVYREVASANVFKLALEFSSDPNFWGIAFPAAQRSADAKD